MALAFASGSLTLANWGFGVGDIAVLAGAGRNVGNWVMAQTRDRNLVDFLKVDIDTVIIRRGLIDVVELHKRWDRKLTLFQNGRPISVEHPAGSQVPVVDNMDKFTWFMTLVIATLDAAIGPSYVHQFVSSFLSRLFEDSPDGMEYLVRETPQHVQGWRSSACVRGIIAKAELLWKQLAQRGEHWPGWIPSADCGEVMRLLVWLTTEKSPLFTTASSDAFCLAIVLSEIGIKQITAVKTRTSNCNLNIDADESVIRVALDTSWLPTRPTGTKIAEDILAQRHGMTIPLNHMEECMSLWPTDRDFAARLRTLFVDGMETIREDGLMINTPEGIQDWNFDYLVSKNKPLRRSATRRLDTLEYRVIDAFLPGVSDQASQHIQKLLSRWDSRMREDMESYLKKETETPRLHLQPSAHAELQAFLLGYYYALLRPLVDCTRLSVQEVYGAWGYTSDRFLIAIRQLKHQTTNRQSRGSQLSHAPDKEPCQMFQRETILYLVAFLFAGLESNSGAVTYGATSNLAIASATSTIGILSKISVIPRIMLGSRLERQHAGQLCLLDCDTSFIPCNTSGCVQDGLRSFLLVTDVDADTESNLNGEELLSRLHADNTADFTPHIEPDWDNDVQCSMMVYRHQGRIVYSMPFSSILAALTRDNDQHESMTALARSQRVQGHERTHCLQEKADIWATWANVKLPGIPPPNTSMVLTSPQDFHGSKILWNQACDGSAIVVASLIGMPNAVLCVLAMYSQRTEYLWFKDVIAVVSHPDDFVKALEAEKQYFIIF
jgi:hypothetical protein